MKQNYEPIKESFLTSYKSFIDFIMLTNNDNNMYNILVLKKPINDRLSNVCILVRSLIKNNCDNISNAYHEFSSNVTLSNDEARQLVDDIRCDFCDKHIIKYASVNPRAMIQTLQNSTFSLNIKLSKAYELEEAVDFNAKINSDEKRLVLTRN